MAPTIINTIHALARHDYEVHLLTRAPDLPVPDPPKFPAGVQQKTYDGRSSRGPRPSKGFWSSRLGFARFVLRLASKNRYEMVIGVDANGQIVSSLAAMLYGLRTAHLSLEVHGARTGQGISGALTHRILSWAHRRTAFTLVQDHHRARLLEESIGQPLSDVVTLPNAPSGPPFRDRSDRLRKMLNLPAHRPRIALHIGMIGDAVLSRQLAAASREWPDGWILIFHERQAREDDDPYLHMVRDAGGSKVRFSTRPVRYDELDALVASADVGIALYDPRAGLTYSAPGSSGKIAQYLKCGLPVVCSDLPGLREPVGEFDCGVVVGAPEEIGQALSRIEVELDRYRANAFRCYEEWYEFNRHFEQVIRRI